MTSSGSKFLQIIRGELRMSDLDKKLDYGESSPSSMYSCRYDLNTNYKSQSSTYGRGNITVIATSSSSMSRSTPNFGGFGGR